MKAEVVTEVKSRTNERNYINCIGGFQNNSVSAELYSFSVSELAFFKQKFDEPSNLVVKTRERPSVKQTARPAKTKYISPNMLLRILRRKGYNCLGAPLLARGKYFVMVENERGHCNVVTINARSGVIVKRRYVMRKMATKPSSLFDYIV